MLFCHTIVCQWCSLTTATSKAYLKGLALGVRDPHLGVQVESHAGDEREFSVFHGPARAARLAVLEDNRAQLAHAAMLRVAVDREAASA